MSQSIAEELKQLAESEGISFPPPDLWSNEPPLESDLHREQIELLIRLLKWFWRERSNFYASGNLTIYYSPRQLTSEHFRGPDFFVVLDTEKRDRRSWVVWHEGGKYPNVMVEILSASTAATDRGLKKQIYQDTFRTPDYFWFDPITQEFQGFHLSNSQYELIPPNASGYLWSQQLELYLGIYQGQLRFFTPDEQLILLPEEDMAQQIELERLRAEQATSQAEAERLRAKQAEAELERLRMQLRSQGIDPTSFEETP